MARATKRILGIDPGLNITGYGLLDIGSGDPQIVEAGTIRTDIKEGMARRILQIHNELTGILEEFSPDVAAIEKLYSHYGHPRTAILMAHARGAVMLACTQADVPVYDMPATNVKKSLTGNGHATKLQMQRAIQAVFQLKELPQPADVADALAIALCATKHI